LTAAAGLAAASKESEKRRMAKGKYTPRKLSTAQVVFYVLSAILVLSMVLSAVMKY
jgi:hypothetical protein